MLINAHADKDGVGAVAKKKSRLFWDYKEHFVRYCKENDLHPEKVETFGGGSDGIAWVLLFDPEKGELGLTDDRPAKCLLFIHRDEDGNVTFEETEYTRKYLS